VPEAIKNGTICDHLPETQKITCLMNLVAPEKAVVREWKSDSCWMPNMTTDACKLDPMSCLEWLEHCPAGGVPVPDPLKTAQDGYDCTMGRTLKTITISCTLKEK
jgi:hypothetical protein